MEVFKIDKFAENTDNILAEDTENVPVEKFELTNQKGVVEALIFASAQPITLTQLAKTAKISKSSVNDIIDELNDDYLNSRRSFKIENVAGGYKMYTLPEFHKYINHANLKERTQRLSPAALEALAVIAYKQPVTRSEIERIRGVDCGGVLKNLLSKNLLQIDGRSPAPGNPILYRTSEFFLEFFGLPALDHLPPLAEIEEHDKGLPSLKLIKPGENDGGNGENPHAFEEKSDSDDAVEMSAESDTQLTEEVGANVVDPLASGEYQEPSSS
ncbi:MAG: SMC-Scp complex subunit ScpB [candidate division Zixibacteria bacterium]|nr:SMC-Scp complex subunit ScpB [candidate division Zixibacteria bacterium]